jgi:hypothetical protein
MHIESIRTLSGPNIYSHRPVLLMRLDLDDLDEKETREFKGFNDRLVACLPGLNDHPCSLGRPGGFVQRLHEGTTSAMLSNTLRLNWQRWRTLARITARRAMRASREFIMWRSNIKQSRHRDICFRRRFGW